MKSPCAVKLHNAVAVPHQRLRKRVAQLSSARMNEVCGALRFPLGCDSNSLVATLSLSLNSFPIRSMSSKGIPFAGIQLHRTVGFKQVEFERVVDFNKPNPAISKQRLRLVEGCAEDRVLHGI
jgi:hypothetical protein